MALLLSACIDNNSNFDYKKINTSNGYKVKGLARSYNCFEGDELLLEPEIKMSLDTINPDVSYEWYVGSELRGKEKAFVFKADNVGKYILQFVTLDNKTGVRFPYEVSIKVESRLFKGWLLLSKSATNASEISMVWSRKTTYKIKDEDGNYILDDNGEYIERDTVLYEGESMNICPNLGYGPIKLVENFTFKDKYYDGLEFLSDEVMVVQDDKCVELNGNTFEVMAYAEDEFSGSVPRNFEPCDAVLTWGCKCLLNKDHTCSFSVASVATDLHTGRYSPDPAWNGRYIQAIYPMNKGAVLHGNYFLALDETNTLFGIADNGKPKSDEPLIDVQNIIGQPIEIADSRRFDMSRFKNIPYEIIYTGWENGDFDENTSWVSIFKEEETSSYYMHTYSLVYDEAAYYVELAIKNSSFKEVNPDMFDNYSGATIFPHKDYIMIANGNELWLCYYKDKSDKGRCVKTFDSKIASISSKDVNVSSVKGHVGVALENGDFYVFEVDCNKNSETKEVKLNKLYYKSGFGEVVDVIYKFGTITNLVNEYLF